MQGRKNALRSGGCGRSSQHTLGPKKMPWEDLDTATSFTERITCPRRCKTSSVGQSAGLSISRSSVRFLRKLKTSDLKLDDLHEFELHRPSSKGTKLLFQVTKKQTPCSGAGGSDSSILGSPFSRSRRSLGEVTWWTQPQQLTWNLRYRWQCGNECARPPYLWLSREHNRTVGRPKVN